MKDIPPRHARRHPWRRPVALLASVLALVAVGLAGFALTRGGAPDATPVADVGTALPRAATAAPTSPTVPVRADVTTTTPARAPVRAASSRPVTAAPATTPAAATSAPTRPAAAVPTARITPTAPAAPPTPHQGPSTVSGPSATVTITGHTNWILFINALRHLNGYGAGCSSVNGAVRLWDASGKSYQVIARTPVVQDHKISGEGDESYQCDMPFSVTVPRQSRYALSWDGPTPMADLGCTNSKSVNVLA